MKLAHDHSNGLYAAEQRAFRGRLWDRDKAMALADAQELVDRHVRNVRVVRSKSGGYWNPRERIIGLDREACMPVVLHELAHAKVSGRDRGHGVTFMKQYVLLVDHHMGEYWRRRLVKSIEVFQPRGWRQVVEFIRACESAQAALHSGLTATKEASQ